MNILVVEDDFASRKLAQMLFSVYGHVDVAADGDEAVSALLSDAATAVPYDLVVLDIMLPGKDGQKVLRLLREWEENRGIFGSDAVKVIMMTALDDHTNVMSAFNNQCDGYMVKPIDKEKVNKHMVNFGFVKAGS